MNLNFSETLKVNSPFFIRLLSSLSLCTKLAFANN